MKILVSYLKPYRWLVTLTLVLAAINTGFSLMDPIIFGKLVRLATDYRYNTGAYGQNDYFWSFSTKYPGVLFLLLCSIGVAMVSRIAKNFQDYFLNVIVQKFGARVFTDGLKHAMKLPYQDFEDQRSGETLSVLTKVRADTEKFMNYFINILFGVIVGILFVCTYAALYIHWSIPIVYFAGIILLTTITNLLSKKIKIIQKNIVGQTTALAGSTTESLRNIELVKSLGLTSQEVDRLNKNTYKILGLELTKIKRIRSISFIQGTFVNTLRQVILFILMYLIFGDVMDAGQLVTMQVFSFFVFGPLQEIGNIILAWREAEASLTAFGELMQKPIERRPPAFVEIGPLTQVRFDHVGFRHKGAADQALEDVSFSANLGDTIAFVGPSGSGKSTLVKLLVGLYTPDSGEVSYNATSTRSLRFNEVRRQFGFVTQDTHLFAGSIRENIQLVKPDATDDEIIAAMRQASCAYLLEKSSLGLDATIGEHGMKLSGGEKQRLSIARALIRQPRLLIFDEATSALDSITEEQITATVREVSASSARITILIAHRLSTVMHADTIYVLEKGRIVESSRHAVLLERKGLYYAMWRQQIGERPTLRVSDSPA